MRKKLLILSLLPLLILTACGKSKANKSIVQNLSFEVSGVWENTEYTMSAKTEENILFLEVKAPEVISGLKLQIKGDEITLNYLGLAKKLPLASFGSSPIGVLGEAFANSKNSSPSVFVKNENPKKEFTLNEKVYILYFTEGGIPLKITERGTENSLIFQGTTLN